MHGTQPITKSTLTCPPLKTYLFIGRVFIWLWLLTKKIDGTLGPKNGKQTTSSTQSMSHIAYTELMNTCMKDSVFKALYEGNMSWADTEDEEPCMTRMQANVMQKLGELPLNKFFPNLFQSKECNVSIPTPIDNGIKTLIVRNLPRNIVEKELRTLFELYGSVRDIYIPKNMDKSSPHYGSIKGFALVKYNNSEESCVAYHSIQGRLTIRGKPILVEFAKADR